MSRRVRIGLILGTVIVASVAHIRTLANLAAADVARPALASVAAHMSSFTDVDLDVTFIHRDPQYRAYCTEAPWDIPGQPGILVLCPGTENDRRWPEPGEMVTFTAHVVNKGTAASPAFEYAWQIDGVQVAQGTLAPLEPAAEATATYHWPWAHPLSPDGQQALGEHTVGFIVDPGNHIAETFESNNYLQDRTNAMSFSIYITPEMYEAYNVPVDPRWPRSAEDWLQKQVAAMNDASARSIYPATPQGATLRVRINTIAVTSDNPGADGAHDGGWFIRDDVRCDDCGYYDLATDTDWGMVHELSHQVSLIDLYAIGIIASDVTTQGQDGMPVNVGFGWDNGGIMGGGDTAPHNNPHLYSSHSAAGASTYAGYRNGYYGSYLYDIPLENDLRILDSQGNPAAGVAVSLYQRSPTGDIRREFGIDNRPDIEGTTDADGIFPLPNRSANGGTTTLNGHVLHDNPFGVVDIVGNLDLFLVRLARDGHEECHWLDITQLNLAYWLGDTDHHTFTISSHLPLRGAPAAPQALSARVEGTWARLSWQPSPSSGVTGYRVYRAAAPRYEYLAVSGLLTENHFQDSADALGDGQHRLYVVTAVGDDGRESGFSHPVYAPSLGSPAAVALAPDGSRTVLNKWNLYPLLRQQTDGRYTQRLVNVEYDLDAAHSLAYDPEGRLWVSGFGRLRDERYAVRAYDAELRPLVAFGSEGDAPGQFMSPAGLAVWGEPSSVGGPYEPDEHTLLLLHFDGDYDGAQGETATAVGTTFAPGKFGQGALIDASDTLTYPTAGNVKRTAGSIEFWVSFSEVGDVGQIHDLFEFDDVGGGIQIVRHGGGSLHYLMRDSTSLVDLNAHTAHWQAGEWHHVASTWQDNRMVLLIDGFPQASSDRASPPESLADTLYVGSSPRGDWQAKAVIDELRISDVPRVGNRNSSGQILVADSGTHRIQAFDIQGNLISVYGGLGSGAGQFHSPQGLAVDASGRVIVVDQGNNRLVVLSFDGKEFGYLDSFDAGLNAPTGVAVDAEGRIVVADTGNNRIVVLGPQGDLLHVFTEPNDGHSGPFSAPRGVAVEDDGDLVVADTGNSRVVTVRGVLPAYVQLWLPVAMRNSIR